MKATAGVRRASMNPSEYISTLGITVDILPDPTFAVDLSGTVILWNKAMEELTGVNAGDMVGRSGHAHGKAFYDKARPMLADLLFNPDEEVEKTYEMINREAGTITACSPVTVNGCRRHIWGKASLLVDLEGTPIGAIEILRDVSELKQSEEKYRDIFLNSSDLIYIHDLQGRFIDTNLAAKKETGYSEEDLKTLSVQDILPPRHRDRFINYLRNVVNKGSDEGYFTIMTKDGSERIMEYRNNLVRNPDGSPKAVRGMARDITSRLKMHKKLRRERDLVTAIIQTSPAFFDAIDTNGEITMINRAMLDALGYKAEEVLGKNYTDMLVAPEDRVAFTEVLKELSSTNRPVVHEKRMLKKNGEALLVEWHSRALPGPDGSPDILFGIGIDITEKRKAEKAFMEQQRQLEMLIGYLPGMVYRCRNDRNWTMEFISGSSTQITGYAPEELMHNRVVSYAELVHPEDRERIWEEVQQALMNRSRFHLIYRVRTRDASERWVWEQGQGVFDENGELEFLEGYIMDVTDREEARQAYRQSEERLRRMAQVIPVMFCMTNPAFDRLIYVNPACSKVLGVDEQALHDNPRAWLSMVHPEDSGPVTAAVGDCTREADLEFRIAGPEGHTRWIHMRLTPVSDENGSPVCRVGTAEDITGRKRIEQERELTQAHLDRARKLEAIGTLAGGIAHDFNNILVAIMGYSELALEDMPRDNPAAQSISEVIKAGERARDLIRQILTFSRQVESERRLIKVLPIAKEAMKFLRASIPRTVAIVEHMEEDTGFVLADPIQIQQIILNLCTNAYQAMMPKGGVMTVEARPVNVDERLCSMHPGLGPGMHTLISVADTGCGMDDDTMKRVFDPFFTTKEKTKGTGLGLATVHGIVTSLGGAVAVRSEKGKGSVFEVYLPVMDQVTEDVPADLPEMIPLGNGETVMVVDDEEPVVEITASMLEQLGYRVVTAASSDEALKRLRENPAGVDLVITDQTMPGMTGAELALEMLGIRPDLRVALMSGFSEFMGRDDALALGIREYMEKPFTLSDLASLVRRCLKG
jgi:PAS domain S-box-containing protein